MIQSILSAKDNELNAPITIQSIDGAKDWKIKHNFSTQAQTSQQRIIQLQNQWKSSTKTCYYYPFIPSVHMQALIRARETQESSTKHVERHHKTPDGHVRTEPFTYTRKFPENTERSCFVLV
mgnify:CR=1 FL=1